jgi:hypothetical protein
MFAKEDFNRLVRRTAALTVALMAALVFGLIVLAEGDWLPGGIMVGASLVGLARQIPIIWRLCSVGPPPPPRSTPTS